MKIYNFVNHALLYILIYIQGRSRLLTLVCRPISIKFIVPSSSSASSSSRQCAPSQMSAALRLKNLSSRPRTFYIASRTSLCRKAHTLVLYMYIYTHTRTRCVYTFENRDPERLANVNYPLLKNDKRYTLYLFEVFIHRKHGVHFKIDTYDG